jgi:hypothetical protein
MCGVAGDLAVVSGTDLLQASNSFPASGKASRGEAASDTVFVSSRKIAAAADAWTPGEEGLEHMALTVWMHPRHAGHTRIRLLAGYEAPGGLLRSTHFAFDIRVVSALSGVPSSVSPVSGTLASWQVEVLVRQHREHVVHSTLPTGSFVFDTVAVKSEYWQLVRNGGADAAASDDVQVQKLGSERRVEADVPCPAVIQLRPWRSGLTGNEELRSQMNSCSLKLPWQYLPAGCSSSTTVGIFGVPSMQLSELLQGNALRMTAEVLGAAPGAVHACTLRFTGAETVATVRLRIRNCSTHAMSLCIECGEQLHPQPSARKAGGGVATGVGGEEHVGLKCITMPALRRHRWLGGLRCHIRSLPAQAEESHSVRLALKGLGAFSVNDFICTWNVPECGILGRVVQGEQLEVYVES